MKSIIQKIGIIFLSILLLSGCIPTDIIDENPQNENNNSNDIILPNESIAPEEPDVQEPDEPNVSEPDEPTINYQEIVDNYLSEEVVYYIVENNAVYTCESERTRYYSEDATIEDMGRITDEILAETANAIGCDVANEDFKFLLADYKVSYAIYNGKIYRYFYEEEYLETIYEHADLGWAQFYTNQCVTVALYSQRCKDFLDSMRAKGYNTWKEIYDADIDYYGELYDKFITVNLITGEETLLEGRKSVVGDPYSEIAGNFSGVYTIE